MKKFISLFVAFAIALNFICVQVAAEDDPALDIPGLTILQGEETAEEEPSVFKDGTVSLEEITLGEEVGEISTEEGSETTSDENTSSDDGFVSTDEEGAPLENETSAEEGKPVVSDETVSAENGVSSLDSIALLAEDQTIVYNGITFSWSFNENNETLTVVRNTTETGFMPSFTADNLPPWYAIKDSIKYISLSKIDSIGDYAFKDCTNLVEIPHLPIKRVNGRVVANEIGQYAFSGCTNLVRALAGSNNPLDIKQYAFSNCTSLKEIFLNDSRTKLESGVFQGCTSLETIVLYNNGDSAITSLSDRLFEGCTNLSSVTLPLNLKSIGENTFKGCSSLTNVTLPAAVTEIGYGAFLECINLENINLDNISVIGDLAFCYCDSLKGDSLGNIVLPNATSVGANAFTTNNGELKALFIPEAAFKEGGSSVVHQNTYLALYTQDDAKKEITITKIMGPDRKELAIPESIVYKGETYKVIAVEKDYWGYVSSEHNHVKPSGTDKVCPICGNPSDQIGTSDIYWAYDKATATLTISGIGTMPDSDFSATAEKPWHEAVKDDVDAGRAISLFVREGVGSIANYAFSGMKLASIELRDHLSTIGSHAFANIELESKTIYIPQGTTLLPDCFFGSEDQIEMIGLSTDSGRLVVNTGTPEAPVYAMKDPTFLPNATKLIYHLSGNKAIVDGYIKADGYFNEEESGLTRPDFICGHPTGDSGSTDTGTHKQHDFNSSYGLCTLCKNGIETVGGRFGDNAIWYVSSNGTIIVEAKAGAKIDDYTRYEETPWYKVEIGTGESWNIALDDIKKIDIKSGITEIGDYAFSYLKSLVEVNVPDTVTRIGANAFKDCVYLESINIPSGVAEIGNKDKGEGSTFENCAKLKNIVIPASVQFIGKDTFKNCSALDANSGDPSYGYFAYHKDSKVNDTTSVHDDVNGPNTIQVPNRTFRIKYEIITNDKGETGIKITEIVQDKDHTFNTDKVVIPPNFGNLEILEVEDEYKDRVSQDETVEGSHKHHYNKDHECTICGRVQGDADEKLEGAIKWTFKDGVLTIMVAKPESGENLTEGTMYDYTALELPWYKFTGSNSTDPDADLAAKKIITKVVIEGGVKNIGNYAFAGCKYLTDIEIPSSVTRIGQYAFANCESLVNLVIPDTVQTIGANLIENNGPRADKGIPALALTISNELYESSTDLFQNGKNIHAVVLKYNNNSRIYAAEIIDTPKDNEDGCIPGSVADIIRQNYEHYGKYDLIDNHDHCYIGNQCILCGAIGGNCGPNYQSNAQWTLRDGVLSITGSGEVGTHPWTDIDLNALRVPAINTVNIGDDITSICNDAFKNIGTLKTLNISSSSKLTTIGDNAFEGTGLSGIITLPAGVRSIGNKAFDASGIDELVVSDGYPDISKFADGTGKIVLTYKDNAITGIYNGRGGNTAVTIPSKVFDTTITAVNNKNKNVATITGVTLPNTVTAIGNNAFEGFSGLTSINLANVTSIGNSAFIKSGLTSIRLPNNVKVGNYAFSGTMIKEVTIPADAVLGNGVFSSNSQLTNVTVAEGVAEIKPETFKGCVVLANVNFPSTLRSIGNSAFASTALTDLNLYETDVRTIGKGAFESCANLAKVTLPKNTETIGDSAFASTALTEINLYETNVKTIGDIAFGGTQLKKLKVPYTVENIGLNSLPALEMLLLPKPLYSKIHVHSTTTIIMYDIIDGTSWITGADLNDNDDWNVSDETEDNPLKFAGGMAVHPSHDHCYSKAMHRCVLCNSKGGKCGEHATWIFTSDGTLTINGTGDMYNVDELNESERAQMWYGDDLPALIKKVVVNEGITSIGNHAFDGEKDKYPLLERLYIPASVTSVGNYAFREDNKLRQVEISSGTNGSQLTEVKAGAFEGCTALSRFPFAHTTRLQTVGSGAFKDTSIDSADLSYSITSIGTSAFEGCENLKNVSFAETLVGIGDRAFRGCESLTKIILPANVEALANTAAADVFYGCDNLTLAIYPDKLSDAAFPDSLDNITKIRYTADANTKTAAITGTSTTFNNIAIEIPAHIVGYTVTALDTGAFDYTSVLRYANVSVSLPSTLKTIRGGAFEGCTWLKELTIPNGVTSIGDRAFQGCNALTELVIPNSVESLGEGAFYMCTKLRKITLSDNLQTIERNLFYGCNSLEYVLFPASVESVTPDTLSSAFDDCGNLIAVFVKEGAVNSFVDGMRIVTYEMSYDGTKKELLKVLEKDDTSTFRGVLEQPEGTTVSSGHTHKWNVENQCILCGNMGGNCGLGMEWELTEDGTLHIIYHGGDGKVDISNDPYGAWTAHKDKIYNIVVDSGITSLPNRAFEGSSVVTVSLPDTLDSIGSEAFANCIGLGTIEIPDSVTTIGTGAFRNDRGLKYVKLPTGLNKLSDDIFNGCISLESIELPDNIVNVGEGAFSGCRNLKTLLLPLNIYNIYEGAFSDCNLEYIIAPERCKYDFDDEFPDATYIKYKAEGAGVTLTHIRPGKDVTNLVIPSEIKGRPVVSISDDAYVNAGIALLSMTTDDATGVKEIVIAASLENIGERAFFGITTLERVIFEEGSVLQSIGKSTFEGCVNLNSINLPSTLRTIGERAFYDCKKLGRIPMNEGLEEIGDEAFSGCNFNSNIHIVPSTVTSLGSDVFGNIAPSAVIAIPENCNYNAEKDECGFLFYRVKNNGEKEIVKAKLGSGMKRIDIPEEMTIAPGHEAGTGHEPCWVIENVFCALCDFVGGDDIGDSEEEKVYWKLNRETGLLSIWGNGRIKDFFGEDVAPWYELKDYIKAIEISAPIENVSANAFRGLDKVETADIPETVIEIGTGAFANCTLLNEIGLPAGLETIGIGAFENCASLTSAEIPTGVARIEKDTFSGCEKLENVKIPEGVSFIGENAFKNTAMNRIVLPDNVHLARNAFAGTKADYIAAGANASIPTEAVSDYPNTVIYFYNSDNDSITLTGVRMGNNIQSLSIPYTIGGKDVKKIEGINGFIGAERLSYLTIPNTVEEIGSNAFVGCSSLISLRLSENLTSIGSNAFNGCSGMSNLVLPNSLKSIGEYAFANCGGLTTLTLNDGLETIGDYAFSGCGKLTSVKIPYSVKAMGAGAFTSCDNLTSMAVPEEDFYYSPGTLTNPENSVQATTIFEYTVDENGSEVIMGAKLGKNRQDIQGLDTFDMEVSEEHRHCFNSGNACVLCNDMGGKCGENASWSLNDGVLHITGTGAMDDFANGAPWDKAKDQIEKVIIDDGITSIGNNAFKDCKYLWDISEALPDSITRIGNNAFFGCTAVTDELVLSDNITEIGNGAFVASRITMLTVFDSDKTSNNIVNDGTTLVKYVFDGENAVITYIELAEDLSKTAIPDPILDHKVVKVEKAYRPLVDCHDHHHSEEEGNHCTLCDLLCGKCGENVFWTIVDGKLVISGTGDMDDYDVDGNEAPWMASKDEFDAIIIEEGITHIGSSAFTGFDKATAEIVVPRSVTTIGDLAFAGYKGIIYIPSNTEIAEDAYSSKDVTVIRYDIRTDANGESYAALTRVDLPEGVEKIDVPTAINDVPIKFVEEPFRKYFDQDSCYVTTGHIYQVTADDPCRDTCVLCGKINFTHIWGNEWKYDDNNHWHECTRPNHDPNVSTRSDFGPHIGEWVVVKEATVDEEGLEELKCTICGFVKTKSIPKKDPEPPVSDSSVDTPPSDSSENTPPSDSSIDTPPSDSSIDTPPSDSSIDTPPSDSSIDTPPSDSSIDTPPSDSSIDTPPSDSSIDTPPSDSSDNPPSSDSSIDTPPTDSSSDDPKPPTPPTTPTNTDPFGGSDVVVGPPHSGGSSTTSADTTLPISTSATAATQPEPVGSRTVPPVTNPPAPDSHLPSNSQVEEHFTLSSEISSDIPSAAIVDSARQVLAVSLTSSEIAAIANGTSDIQVILSVTGGDGTVSLRDRAIISAALGEYQLGMYIDISLYKVVNGVRERITQTSEPLTITITLPNSLLNSGRRFRVIRSHDGKAVILRDLDNNPNTITISTDKFSPYAIAYTDSAYVSEDYDPPMPTGDVGISVFIFVAMASGLTAMSLIYFNHASDVVIETERRKKISKLIAFGKKNKFCKYIAIPLIFLVTLYYEGMEGIQRSQNKTAKG